MQVSVSSMIISFEIESTREKQRIVSRLANIRKITIFEERRKAILSKSKMSLYFGRDTENFIDEEQTKAKNNVFLLFLPFFVSMYEQ